MFVFNFAEEGGDIFTDVSSGFDHIRLNFGVSSSDVDFVGFAGPDDTPDGGPVLTYSDVSGELNWDPTGGDPGDASLLATLSNSPVLQRSDIQFDGDLL